MAKVIFVQEFVGLNVDSSLISAKLWRSSCCLQCLGLSHSFEYKLEQGSKNHINPSPQRYPSKALSLKQLQGSSVSPLRPEHDCCFVQGTSVLQSFFVLAVLHPKLLV